jgi:hypothetical protein
VSNKQEGEQWHQRGRRGVEDDAAPANEPGAVAEEEGDHSAERHVSYLRVRPQDNADCQYNNGHYYLLFLFLLFIKNK